MFRILQDSIFNPKGLVKQVNRSGWFVLLYLIVLALFMSLGNAVAYISYDNPVAATKWIDNLFKKVEILKSAPEIGRVVPEIQRKDIRELIFGNYRIIYRLEKGRICILTVRHGKQILL